MKTNIDVLISKYLDGSLSKQEDLILRDLIKNNPECKEKFEQSIQIYLAVKKDAEEIEVPAELLEKTEEMILARIMGQQPIIVEAQPIYAKTKKKRLLYILAPAIVVFLMLVSTIEISDGLITYNFNNTKKVLFKETNANSNEVAVNSNIFQKNTNEPNKKTQNFAIVTNVLKNDELNELSSVNSFTELIEEKEVDIFNKNNDIGESIIVNEENENYSDRFTGQEKVSLLSNIKNNKLTEQFPIENSSFDLVKKKFQQNFYIKDYYYTGRDIWVSSFLGMDLISDIKGTSDNFMITQFSQGIAYSVAKNHKIGLEIGYIDYSYNKEDVAIYKNQIKADQSGAKVEVINSPSEDIRYFAGNVYYNSHKQIYWTSAFYEYSFLDINKLSLNSRLALGFSDEGFLTYSKVYAQFNILTNLGLTLGAEGRLFQLKLPLNGNDEVGTYKTFSFIYGLQFKF